MAQIAMIQPAAAQAPPPSPPANNDPQSFSPHLDKAIANNKDTPPTREGGASKANGKKTPGKTDTNNKKEAADATPSADTSGQKSVSTEEVVAEGNNDKQTEDQTPVQNNLVIFMATGLTISQPVITNQADVPATPALGQTLANNSQLFEFLTKTPASGDEKSGQSTTLSPIGSGEKSGQPAALSQTGSDEKSGQSITLSQKALEKVSEGGLLSSLLAKTTEISAANPGASPATIQSPEAKPATSVLAQQLQKIIADSGEVGKVSITVTGNTIKAPTGLNNLQATAPVVTPASEVLPQATNPANFPEFVDQSSTILASKGGAIPGEQNSHEMPSLRHSLRQEYYEAKFALQNDKGSNTSAEGEQQDKTFSQKGAQALEKSTLSALNTDQTNTFAQPLSLLQEGQKPQTAEGLRPVTLPSGTVVQQEEVIRQITQHLQIARRDNDTKVNIQLHPAELGELKIGLSVKEGSVHANVVASSQYAQEIIEKNMTKLRAVLENQGFTVGEMSVTCKSDTAGEFNLFERQLFSKNDYTPPSTKKNQTPGSLFPMDARIHEQAGVSGVNVKI